MKNLQGRSAVLDVHAADCTGEEFNDEIGKLMHDFSCANPDDMNYEALAKKARYFKRDEEEWLLCVR